MKEISGIFKSKKDLDLAFEELEKIGIKKEDINLLAREKDVQASLGKNYSSVHDLDDKSNIPRIKYLSEKSFYNRENFSISILYYLGIIGAVTITAIMHKSIGFDIAIAFFAGTVFQIVGISISGVIRKRHGDYIERKLKKGGFLFWIKVKNEKNLQLKIRRILKKHLAQKIHVINAH